MGVTVCCGGDDNEINCKCKYMVFTFKLCKLSVQNVVPSFYLFCTPSSF